MAGNPPGILARARTVLGRHSPKGDGGSPKTRHPPQKGIRKYDKAQGKKPPKGPPANQQQTTEAATLKHHRRELQPDLSQLNITATGAPL